MKLLLPKDFFDIHGTSDPLFFLAGPVRGGDEWHVKCCEEISKRVESFYAATSSPVYLNPEHPLHKYKVTEGNENHFEDHLSWKRHYLRLAASRARRGCVIFWLPQESKTNPRKGGHYGRDTIGDLGEWRGRLMASPLQRVVIGGEKEFPGFDMVVRNFHYALGDHFEISPTLEATVERAIEKALK
jgi:hypothetical protein